MSTFNSRIRSFVTGVIVTLAAAGPVLADDAEIYSSQAPSTGAQPNVLFIMDTSGSMDTEVEQSVPAYDPNASYSGSCDDNNVYYSKGTDDPPSCGTYNYIPRTKFVCGAATVALAKGGGGTYPGFGDSRARAAQIHGDTWEQNAWNYTDYVECQADYGVHGVDATNTRKWARNGNSTNPWTATQPTNSNIWNGLTAGYRFYSANYLNYYNSVKVPQKLTRLQVVRDVAINLASSLNNVNLGLMRYSTDAQGGYVLNPIAPIATNRSNIVTQLNSFKPADGSGGTPLSETLYEAALYLTGSKVDYGAKSSPGKSTSTTAVKDGNYVSPIQYSCQKNYIVYLTDGAPTVDDDANGKIASMIGSTCKDDQFPPDQDSGYTAGSGKCMDDLAAWLNAPTTDLNKNVAETQNAQTYMIGFGSSLGDKSVKYLNMVAAAGGTSNAYTAADVPTLTNALQQIFSNIQEDSSTFVTPSISVNAFNRAQTDQDLYFSLFKASNRSHWPGNLKKYKLTTVTSTTNGVTTQTDKIIDANNADAVDGGFFAKSAKSFWSASVDGTDIESGGAASNQALPANRVIYTQLGTSTLKGDSKNLLDTSNTLLTDKIVGTGSDTAACSDACKNAINWLRGVDVNDDNKNNDKTDQHKFMGDPLHGKPAVVPYGKLAGDLTDATVFVPTNDGLLHAINGRDDVGSGGGKELWAFMPPELLSRLGTISQTGAVTSRSYGLDGDIRVLRMDKNQDGVVSSTDDRVWLFFGMRMGGNHYYGLDVTDRTNPKLMWNIGPNQLPQVGQTWSAPVVARVNVKGGNDDPEKFVLIFGGGYDMTQESQAYSTDKVGNRIFMVDAKTGKLLWFAGGTYNATGTQPDLKLDDPNAASTPPVAVKTMNNSIPARVNVIDTNGDGFADRLYVGDMGGRIWRVDITNGNDRATLATGGVIAALGSGGVASPAVADSRRFYNAPDVALIQARGQDPFYNIAIGSGYRGHPLDNVTHERFYSVRDKLPFASLTQKAFNENKPLTEADLTDVTSQNIVSKDAAGWRMDMFAAGKWAGEKVLSESVTVSNSILFTSFEPSILGSNKGACYPSTTNRAYAISVFNASPFLDFNDDKTLDKFTELNQEGIVGDIQVALKRSDSGGPNGSGGGPVQTICLAGTQVLKKCVQAGGTVRTFWNRKDAQ